MQVFKVIDLLRLYFSANVAEHSWLKMCPEIFVAGRVAHDRGESENSQLLQFHEKGDQTKYFKIILQEIA